MKKATGKILSLCLALAMVLGLAPVQALAEGGQGGTCGHEHDAVCGYDEGADCTHEHGEGCGDDCIHNEGQGHDEDCGYREAAPCAHQHDEDCGGLSVGQSDGEAPTPPVPPPTTEQGTPPANGPVTRALTDYDPAAVAVINGMITNNNLAAKGYAINDPENWDFATWDSSSPLKKLTELNLFWEGLTGDLTISLGSLQILRVNTNNLQTLDVSGCTNLKTLWCNDNNLQTLNVSGCTNLQELDCASNDLQTLNVSGCTSLKNLYCTQNDLQTLDVSGCTNLKLLLCYNNDLQTLDVSGCTALTSLSCGNNPLETLKMNGYELVIPAATGGTVKMTNFTFSSKQTELTATADSNYTFSGWTYFPTGSYDTTSNPVTFTLPSGTLTVTPSFTQINALSPDIAVHPQGGTYNVGSAATDLTVSASVTDGGTLSYQWHKNSTDSNTGGSPIDSATGTSYTPPTDTAGTFYYYCVVTNTNNSATGAKTATATSNVATVEVNALVNAQQPSITANPLGGTYNVGGAATALTVSASVTDGGALSYQWYENNTNSNAGGTSIPGATVSSYTPPTATVGTVYYYCVVTNTNNSATGVKIATATSQTAAIKVNKVPDTSKPAPPAYEYQTLRHDATGVTLTGWFAPGTTLNVTQNHLHGKGTCDACDKIRAAGTPASLYDVSITGSHDGNVELALPVPEGYNGQQMLVRHCKLNQVEEMTLTASGGFVKGTFSSLSPFAVFATSGTTATAPQTGDGSNMGLWIALLCASVTALAGCGVVLWRRRRRVKAD